MTVKPALSDSEWAHVRLWAAGKLIGGNRALLQAMEAWEDEPEMRLGIAAHALHGRISWADVDRLRQYDMRGGNIAFIPLDSGLGPIADLLESLLPPREP